MNTIHLTGSQLDRIANGGCVGTFTIIGGVWICDCDSCVEADLAASAARCHAMTDREVIEAWEPQAPDRESPPEASDAEWWDFVVEREIHAATDER